MSRATLLRVVCLVFLLTACGADKVEQTPFKLVVVPDAVRVERGSSRTLSVRLDRPLSDDAAVTAEAPSAGASAKAVVIPAGRLTVDLELNVADTAPLTEETLVLTARAGEETATAQLSLTTVSGPPVASADAAEFRQGYGEAEIKLTGDNLDVVEAVTLEGLDVSILEQSRTDLKLNLTVPHGATLGDKTLTLTSPYGDADLAALTVSPISAAPGGNDATGDGSGARPYRTMTKALSLAEAGDTVRLAKGTYSSGEGEVYPQLTDSPNPAAVTPNVPAGVTLTGSGATILVGDAGRSVALVFAGDASVNGIELSDFGWAAVSTTGEQKLAVSAGATAAKGLLAAGDAVVDLSGSAFDFVRGEALELRDSARVSASSLNLSAATAFRTDDDSQIDLTDASLNGDLFLYGKSVITLSQSTVRGGIYVTGELTTNADEALSLTLKETAITQDGPFAVGIAANGTYNLTLRATTISSTIGAVLVTGNPLKLDLGTDREAGGNSLSGKGDPRSEALLDFRSEGGPDATILTLSGTTLNGILPAEGCVTGPIKQAGVYHLLNSVTMCVYGVP